MQNEQTFFDFFELFMLATPTDFLDSVPYPEIDPSRFP